MTIMMLNGRLINVLTPHPIDALPTVRPRVSSIRPDADSIFRPRELKDVSRQT